MAHKLADETLAAILAQHLAVPDAAFASTDGRSPFARVELSTSTLLLVCKRWMRVATPLLYETVILRSTAQATALASVLKANKDFGRYIRKLRVEGGFGQGVQKIIAAAPNITDFGLSLNLWADDNVKGMCASMPNMNPRRLVVISLNHGARNNASTRLATQTLCDCLASWSKIQSVVVPGTLSSDNDGAVFKAIEACKTLTEVNLTGKTPPFRPANVLNPLAAKPTVTTINVGWAENASETQNDFLHLIFMSHMQQAPTNTLTAEAKAKVKYASPEDAPLPRSIFARDRRGPVISHPLDPSYRPLSNASDGERVAIWTRILEHAIGDATMRPAGLPYALHNLFHFNGPMMDDSDDSEYDSAESDLEDLFYSGMFGISSRRHKRIGPLLSYMLVCKEFKTIATKVACKNMTFNSPAEIVNFAKLLEREPEMAAETTLLTLASYRDSNDTRREDIVLDALRKLTSLRTVECAFSCHVDVGHLAALSEGSGATITALKSMAMFGRGSISLLSGFSALRSLHWAGSAVFDDVEAGKGICFPELTRLTLETFHPSFLDALARCQLPKLDTIESRPLLVYYGTNSMRDAIRGMLAAHGDKIRVAVTDSDLLFTLLEGCACLRELHFSAQPESLPSLDGISHNALEKIKLPGQDPKVVWHKFFAGLTSKKFPALRTIQIPNNAFWPESQRDISRSLWPPVAERLLESGIKMVDGDGIAWRPRLQNASARRR